MNPAAATTLWIEAGAMSGPPEHRHQIEFSNEIAEFFDPVARASEGLILSFNGRRIRRPLTYRGTDYGQWAAIWRLGLPTIRMGGVDYVGRIIVLTKTKVRGGAVEYVLEVLDAGSPAARKLRKGSAGRSETGGPAGREWGWL